MEMKLLRAKNWRMEQNAAMSRDIWSEYIESPTRPLKSTANIAANLVGLEQRVRNWLLIHFDHQSFITSTPRRYPPLTIVHDLKVS